MAYESDLEKTEQIADEILGTGTSESPPRVQELLNISQSEKPRRRAGVIPLFTISDAKERPEEREHFVRYGVHVCGPGRCDRPGSPPPVLVAARVCVTHGVAPIPVPAKQKGPRIKEWQKLRLTEQQLADSFAPDSNIGILNGEPSGGLVDVDLDAPQARSLADRFLPRTGVEFGRASSRRAHRLYQTKGGFPTTDQFRDTDGTMLVELRSTGSQTIIPPSRHPTGEAITFDATGEPADVDGAELRTATARLAATALLARHWPKQTGSRQNHALAVAGYFVLGGLDEETVTAMIV